MQVTADYEGLNCEATLVLSSGTELEISAAADEEYTFTLSAANVSSFENRTFTLTYDPTVLALTDLCAFTYEKETAAGAITGTDITITSVSSGEIQFTIDKSITSGQKWAGILNIFEFQALQTDDTNLTVQ